MASGGIKGLQLSSLSYISEIDTMESFPMSPDLKPTKVLTIASPKIHSNLFTHPPESTKEAITNLMRTLIQTLSILEESIETPNIRDDFSIQAKEIKLQPFLLTRVNNRRNTLGK